MPHIELPKCQLWQQVTPCSIALSCFRAPTALLTQHFHIAGPGWPSCAPCSPRRCTAPARLRTGPTARAGQLRAPGQARARSLRKLLPCFSGCSVPAATHLHMSCVFREQLHRSISTEKTLSTTWHHCLTERAQTESCGPSAGMAVQQNLCLMNVISYFQHGMQSVRKYTSNGVCLPAAAGSPRARAEGGTKTWCAKSGSSSASSTACNNMHECASAEVRHQSQ